MRFQLDPKVHLLICAAGIALTIGAFVLLFQVDTIVHVSLYDYGLQFSYEWATPYWTFLRLTFVLLGCIAGLNVLSMLYEILSARAEPKVVSRERVKLPARVMVKTQERGREVVSEPARVKEDDGVEIAALPMVCSKCGKVFTQPLCMFDFKSGKPRLVNVCPYCNAVLAVSGNSKT